MNHNENQTTKPQTAIEALRQGELICYPTEAIFGLGCDPDSESAVHKLLALKERPIEKGLILIADNFAQCLDYVDDAKIPMDKRAEIFSAWPGPVTWVLPAKSTTPKWLTGEHTSIAVRVTDHPVVKQLCKSFGKPLVSTSANFSGEEPAMTIAQAQSMFGDRVGYYQEGELGGRNTPSQIRDAMTGQVFRN
ncbi:MULTISPECIES: Sua5/YciO/YrdC/YwlC family protein [Pseudoalteromonas]|uniref:Threonylcarbamoyl-AMP synthase n=1 Tax=Pseudoalteromonas obscura TaxID=3048491 RepID=A0ABT7ES23_9GAMM|nr:MULTISPECIES: Sua5/YciO/YrdC/YwlC family protein [Pseudoalteromonas]MBQ4839919.1 Sua5/YciO/YrdC/YwlC family protein [Pseudoalteromonas luteoviolacea]MDK2597846.1 Sua5/YciO/YrdC/YwlC family protein [Pseudoalteromonas sp. P94(2023)]